MKAPVHCLLALACAAPLLAHAQRPDMPPIYPAAKPMARAAAALATPAATPAATTPKAALVQIVDDDAHAAFKEGIFNSCTFAGVCTVQFSAVPAGHRRVVEHVSCTAYVASGGALRYVAFLANSFTAPRDFLPYTRSAADSSQYFVNQMMMFPFDAGETPMVYAYADSMPIQDLTCTVTGRDILVP